MAESTPGSSDAPSAAWAASKVTPGTQAANAAGDFQIRNEPPSSHCGHTVNR